MIGSVQLEDGSTGNRLPSGTPFKLISAASNNATLVKAANDARGVVLLTLSLTNTQATERYVKFFNKATAPNPAVDTPVLSFGVPGNAAGSGREIQMPVFGILFPLGLGLCIVANPADLDNTAVAANDIIVNLAWGVSGGH